MKEVKEMQRGKRMSLPQTNICFKQMAETNTYQIYIYDDVEAYGDWNWETWSYDESETSANHFRDVLAEIPGDGHIELYINSNGGSVKEGIAIFNMLKRHPAQKTGYVDGVAHSIAFVIFQACDKRIMGEGTSALIHEMWVCCCGNAEQLRKEAEQLDTLMKSNRALFMQRAKNISEDELAEMMRNEHILTPDEALLYGFCDEIANRNNMPSVDVGVQQKITDLKTEFQKHGEFESELKEFETFCEKENTQKENREESGLMAAFFNAFI